MLFSSNWLARYVELPEETSHLAELLTRCGMVVEDIRSHSDGALLDLDIPSNRVDAMNHYGLAREIATARRSDLQAPEILVNESDPATDQLTAIAIDDLNGCPRYTARLIRGVKVEPSPQWLANLIESIGLRPLNNVADITNFVLWELGHPLHAFDFDQLVDHQIVVRRARKSESFVALDHIEHNLTSSDLVIADGQRPVALAGVIGGAETSITNDTVNVLIEGAWFDPATVRATAHRLNLHTDASHRFERSPAHDGMLLAIDRAASLIQEIGGGALSRGTIDVVGTLPEPVSTTLRQTRLKGLLGIEVPSSEVEEILTRLGFSLAAKTGGYDVGVPSFRPDVTREEDLIEEVGRHNGYDRLPATLPVVRSIQDSGTPEVLGEQRLKQCLVAAGCREIMSSSLSSLLEQSGFVGQVEDLVSINNPISEELSVLRAHLVPGLLGAVAHNLNHGQTSLRLFEVGRCFAGPLTDDGVTEYWSMAIALTGSQRRDHWKDVSTPVDFYDLKGIVEHVTKQMAWPKWQWGAGKSPGIDQSATALIRNGAGGNIPAGWAGRISADTAQTFDIDAEVWVVELNIDKPIGLPHPTTPYRPVSRFPGGSRDVALVLPEGSNYGVVETTVRAAAAEAMLPLAGITLIEIYKGDEIPPGHRGMTLRFTFRAADRTLTAAEIEAGQKKLVDTLSKKLGARQR
ncbi:MAG: phenylalanine--tRNA ligase subunit beta [Vicinamibacterales bacterium]|nr:phenylalanine--tRNA ligase subunit beta [Vicinamibacterales bacterium]